MKQKASLSIADFKRVERTMRLSLESMALIRQVLVEGKTGSAVARESGKSRQFVSQLVKSFLAQFKALQDVPKDWHTESVSLPPSEWPKVRKLIAAAKQNSPQPVETP